MQHGEYEGRNSGVLRMKIFDANIPTAKDIILELIGKVDKVEQSPKELNAWLTVNLGTDIFGAWVAIENDEPAGVLTCEIVEQTVAPKVYISFWYPIDTSVGKRLLEKCEQWAKAKDMHKLIFYTHSKKQVYGFAPERVIMSKELE